MAMLIFRQKLNILMIMLKIIYANNLLNLFWITKNR